MSFFDDDFEKRYYTPSDERDDIADSDGGDRGNYSDHYFSPLDESTEDEKILPFSHVEFDDEPINDGYNDEDEPFEDPVGYGDHPSERQEGFSSENEVGEYDGDDVFNGENDFSPDEDFSAEDEVFYNETPETDNEYPDEPEDIGVPPEIDQEENFSAESAEDPDDKLSDGSDGEVFDKESEYLFNDDFPEEPETLGRQAYDADVSLNEDFLSSPEQVKGQMSFYDVPSLSDNAGFLKKEDFFDVKPKREQPSHEQKTEPETDFAESEEPTAETNFHEGSEQEKDFVKPEADSGKYGNHTTDTEPDARSKQELRSKYMFIEDDNPNIAKIMVIGVGGAGNNAVNRMIEKNVNTATFVAMNTDRQALIRSKCALENRYQIGIQETKGLGAGSDPEIGERAAEESRELIEQLVDGVDLLFIAAGMGGGTGTGAAPVIAKIAKDKGCVTVAVVTKPFNIEGRKRSINAEKGIANLKKYVDTIIIIPNDKLLEALRPDTPLVDALLFADDTLRQGICGIADIIATNALINLDFADVRTVLKDQGLAHMGIGRAKGENRVMEAVKDAVTSPLLETTIEGARGIILNVTGGKDMTIGQVYEASRQVQNIVDPSANIILGMNIDERLQEELVITLIATGFDRTDDEQDSVRAEETAQERAYKDLFARKPVSEPSFAEPVAPARPNIAEMETVTDDIPEEQEEPAKPPKKDLPLFMRKLFKK